MPPAQSRTHTVVVPAARVVRIWMQAPLHTLLLVCVDGVGDQVHQHLTEATCVAGQRDSRRALLEVDPAGGGAQAMRHQAARVGDDVADAEALRATGARSPARAT